MNYSVDWDGPGERDIEPDEELARSIQRYFLLDERRKIIWGADYNQAARDVYERACRYLGEEPMTSEPGKRTS